MPEIGGGGVAKAPPGGIPGGGAIIGAPTPGGPEGGAKAGDPGVVAASDAPQLRQNFIPGGFSPRQLPQITGNPAPPPGVCAGAADSAVPQFKQNDDPGGLWWPQAEQRSITPLLPRVSRNTKRWEMVPGGFATGGASC
jgi:hypothetical protein